MDRREKEKRELNPEEMGKVSGGACLGEEIPRREDNTGTSVGTSYESNSKKKKKKKSF